MLCGFSVCTWSWSQLQLQHQASVACFHFWWSQYEENLMAMFVGFSSEWSSSWSTFGARVELSDTRSQSLREFLLSASLQARRSRARPERAFSLSLSLFFSWTLRFGLTIFDTSERRTTRVVMTTDGALPVLAKLSRFALVSQTCAKETNQSWLSFPFPFPFQFQFLIYNSPFWAWNSLVEPSKWAFPALNRTKTKTKPKASRRIERTKVASCCYFSGSFPLPAQQNAT